MFVLWHCVHIAVAESPAECCEFQVFSSDNKVWSFEANSAEVSMHVYEHHYNHMHLLRLLEHYCITYGVPVKVVTYIIVNLEIFSYFCSQWQLQKIIL